MMVNGPGSAIARTDPSTARDTWIKKIAFKSDQDKKKTELHILPPNTDVQELNGLDLNVNLTDIQSLFRDEVKAFFHFVPSSDIKGLNNNNSHITQTEVKSMKQLSVFVRNIITYAYAVAFDIEENSVSIEMLVPSTICIQSIDDIKKLKEAETLLPGDILQIRKCIMRNLT